MKHKYLLFMVSLLILTDAAQAQQTTKAATTDYPFELTTDASNPILYYIWNGRGSNGGTEYLYVFANEVPWGDTENKLQIVRQDPRILANQLWYFMAEGDGVMIISAEDNRMITVATTTDAPKCIQMQTAAERTNDYYVWILDLTDGCYAFRTSDGKTFLSHNGNWSTAGPQMGLYNAEGSKDEGSRVHFEKLPIEDYPTHISPMPADNADNAIYTLTSQRIGTITAPGIYIMGGKKHVVR